MIEDTDIETAALATALLCNLEAAKSTKLPLNSGYTAVSGMTDTFVGVGMDGVRFEYPYKQIDRWDDALNPKDYVYYHYEKMDLCAGSVNDDNVYSYHSLSPCLKAYANGVAPGLCKEDTVCDTLGGPWLTAQSIWTNTANHGGIAGIARDGHLIYGPYNDDGELWECEDHDICNGVNFDNDQYAYVGTSTFPYILGCYGPGAIQYYPVDTDCAPTSTMRCSAINGAAFATITFALAVSTLFN